MAGAVVGIDLGTTNTVVAVVRGGKAIVLADEEGHRLLPSVVSFHPNGEVLVGHLARERRLVDARNTVYSIKRLIGRSWASEEVERAKARFPFELREGPTHGPLVVARSETYTLPEISAFVLRKAKSIAEKALGEPVERAVVTVPASFNDLQRASTKVAAREAGLEVLRILNEPTAAALAYGFGKTGSERIAVYDFGGGTFDLTLLDLSGNVFEVIATAGDSFLGGDDVDTAIADKIALDVIQRTRFDPRGDVQMMERLRAAAEQVKIALSSQNEMVVELKELGYGPGGAPIDVKFTMTRPQLETLAGSLVDRTFHVCEEALKLARVQSNAFDNVILVGGSTRIPVVRRRAEEFFGKKAMDRVNPDEVVAIGAAIQAAALTGAERRRAATPAPIADPTLDGGAVRVGRIQTLGGVGKNATGARGPMAPPPARTTGRLVTSAIGGLPGDAPFGVDEPPPVRTPIHGSPMPSRPGHTAPLVPESRQVDRKTGRMLGAPLVAPSIELGNSPDLSPEPNTLPIPQAGRSPFPDHSPEPQLLRNVAPPPSPLRETFDEPTPPPMRAPPGPAPRMRTQMGVAPALDKPKTNPPALSNAPKTNPPAVRTAPSSMPPLPDPGSPMFPPERMFPGSSPMFPGLPEPQPQQGQAPQPQQRKQSSYPPGRGELGGMAAPLLIDVTPLSLAVETVGGWVDRVIERNTPVPCSQTRSFTTSTDGQQSVVIRVCQGEAPSLSQNTPLGELELSGLRAARRGEVTIEVTFELDADGILGVRAKDVETRRETSAKMKLIGQDVQGAGRRMMGAVV